MSNFNNNEYQSLVEDLIGDTFYKDTSVSGKIMLMKQLHGLKERNRI